MNKIIKNNIKNIKITTTTDILLYPLSITKIFKIISKELHIIKIKIYFNINLKFFKHNKLQKLLDLFF